MPKDGITIFIVETDTPGRRLVTPVALASGEGDSQIHDSVSGTDNLVHT